jgi:hypothetical protein
MAGVTRARYKPNIVQTVKTTAFSTASTSFVDVTGLSVAITPRATTSKVLVTVSIFTANASVALNSFNLLQGSTNLAQPAADTYSASMNASMAVVNSDDKTVTLTFLDSPATTSATTYKIQMKVSAGTGYVCRRGDLASVSAASTITVQEIEQ